MIFSTSFRVFTSTLKFISNQATISRKSDNVMFQREPLEYEQYVFLVMSFGLTNAPAPLMYIINSVFKPYLDVFVIIIIDDVLIYSRNEDYYASYHRVVHKTLKDKELYVKFYKCDIRLSMWNSRAT